MPHISSNKGDKNYPQDWDCGHAPVSGDIVLPGTIMGGNGRMEWSPCSVMAFRAHYTQMIAANGAWCMQGER